MDAKPLPARPSLEQYKKQAKELVKAFRAAQSRQSSDYHATHSGVVRGNDAMRSELIERVKLQHPRFRNSTADDVVRTKFALADAQLLIAREHGFESWPKFRKHVEGLESSTLAASLSNPVAAFIEAACVPREAMHSSGTLE